MFAEAKIGETPSEPGDHIEDKNVPLLTAQIRPHSIHLHLPFLHILFPLFETFLEIINIRKKAFFKSSAFLLKCLNDLSA